MYNVPSPTKSLRSQNLACDYYFNIFVIKNVPYIKTLVLAPGIYGDISLQADAVLKLSSGNYVFNNFYVGDNADIIMDVDLHEAITIDIAGDFQLEADAEMKFDNQKYAPAVRIYTNDNNTVYIGANANITGIITAPYAKVLHNNG